MVAIDVTVEEIAILEVRENEGAMRIDDSSLTFMGNPSSEGSVFNTADGDHAGIALRTNTCLDFVVLEFPRATGFRGAPPGIYLGAATGQGTGNTLGVWPEAYVVDTATGTLDTPGGAHDGSDSDLLVRGPDGTQAEFCNGVHEIALGVRTGWDLTLQSEQPLAPPDTYLIPMTGTLVP
ncbi:hypothetical protein [Roseovarius salis]|uniref:hypothetical protein n=1 Tax=Roseovarius salis TaxID=3376063 RepID=UPI0037CBB236